MPNERRIWEELSVFESQDFVRRWYKDRHGRELNAARRREITSCFSQGREYMSSATNAAMSVRPLLLYYGVLSLSRGVILLLDRTKTEASLKASHGLEVVDWRTTLADGIQNVLDLKIRATNGTFCELALASKNRHSTGWWSWPKLVVGTYTVELNCPRFIEDQTTITLDDLISRDHRFLSLYERTTQRSTKVHLSEIIAYENGIEVSLFDLGGVTPETIATRFGVPSNVLIRSRSESTRLPIPNYYFHLLAGDLNELKPVLPVSQYVGNDGMFVLEDFSNGDRFSELLRTFLTAYILGMLVRYFPTHWIALLRNENGDTAQPILMAAINAIERDYPELIAGALT